MSSANRLSCSIGLAPTSSSTTARSAIPGADSKSAALTTRAGPLSSTGPAGSSGAMADASTPASSGSSGLAAPK